jgi:Protein of unknown function (DUF3300)
MILHKRARRQTLPLAIISGILIAIAPVLDGCTHGDSEPAPQSSAQMQGTPSSPSPIPTQSIATPSPTPVAMNPGPPPGAATAEELQELVSPIALYPDLLVAQILAASTYPTQVVEAHRWLEQNPNLTGDALAAKVNPQPWDPSVKSLTQFPPVLQTMNDSLAWTTTLGEAYYNQPADLMNAIQVLRQRAMEAGTLKDTPQQKVELESAPPTESGGTPSQQTIIIQPAEPTVVYVPQYNPQTVYGAPVAAAPGYTTPAASPGYSGAEMLTVGLLSFGIGMLVANAINDNNNHWNSNWHGGSVTYNNNVYVSHSNTVVRPPYGSGGYPRPPYSGAHPRPPYAGNYPRPAPYPGGRPPYNGGRPGEFPATLPATRPYNPAKAKEYAANNPNLTRPNFPNPNTLPNGSPSTLPNKAERNKRNGNASGNQPVQRPANGQTGSVNRSAARNNAASQPARKPDSDPLRGYSKDRDSNGGRKGALGGYQPGGLAQETSSRGRASMGGGGNRQPGNGNNRNNGNSGGRANKGGGGGRGQGGGGGGGRRRD